MGFNSGFKGLIVKLLTHWPESVESCVIFVLLLILYFERVATFNFKVITKKTRREKTLQGLCFSIRAIVCIPRKNLVSTENCSSHQVLKIEGHIVADRLMGNIGTSVSPFVMTGFDDDRGGC